MKALVYYQSLGLNALRQFDDRPLILAESDASHIITYSDYAKEITYIPTESDEYNRTLFVNKVFKALNQLEIDEDHESRHIFEKAGHTSMSIGDYIVFEDGEIYLCKVQGWEIIPPNNKTLNYAMTLLASLPPQVLRTISRASKEDVLRAIGNLFFGLPRCNSKCPNCGHEDVSGDKIEWGEIASENEMVYQKAWCTMCEKAFTENYIYAGSEVVS